jgi:methylated-DNA-protein-cysteine methyltransferase-like protein
MLLRPTYKLIQVIMAVIEISEFTKKVMQQIHRIPKGKVATYKQIATLAGKPQGSRGVSWILHSCSTTYKLPWHRVLNSQGRISFDRKSSNFRQQKKRLEAEGVSITADGELDLTRFQWKKQPVSRKPKTGQPKMFSR